MLMHSARVLIDVYPYFSSTADSPIGFVILADRFLQGRHGDAHDAAVLQASMTLFEEAHTIVHRDVLQEVLAINE